jgi:DNA-directed RNA polymerase subunit RPC12/RpoP
LIRNARASKYGASGPDFLRCDWCGIPVSNNWKIMQDGARFCSLDCYNANTGNGNIHGLSAVMICFGLFAGSLVIQASILTGILMASPLILGGILLYREEKKSIDSVKTRIPKDSRRYDPILVEKISSMAKCPSCGGNLDLADLDNSALIKCEYCGAMGVLKFE